MNDKRRLLQHFLAALAYRTQKALRGAPAGFGDFLAADEVRTPVELIRHMTSVLGYARPFFIGGQYTPEPLSSLDEEIIRFHDMLEKVARHIKRGTPVLQGMSEERLLQGPLADAMTHAGQLAMLRRLACFFFSSRRRHTRLTCDWSSDVCSSDLSIRSRFRHVHTANASLLPIE